MHDSSERRIALRFASQSHDESAFRLASISYRKLDA
jgi:hypothetical protein